MNKAAKTRQFIVEKTAPIFNVKGYAGTSLSDMTDVTGLTKGSIYGNFTNKDEVALAAFDHNLQKIRDIIQREMDKKETMREKLLANVSVYENFLKFPFPQGGCPILNTAIEADDTHPILRQKAGDAIEAWKARVKGLVEEGVRSGEFGALSDPHRFAITMIAMIEGAIMMAKVSGQLSYRTIVLDELRKMIGNL